LVKSKIVLSGQFLVFQKSKLYLYSFYQKTGKETDLLQTTIVDFYDGKEIFVVGRLLLSRVCFSNSIFIPMDEKQANHLKAYGIAYWILKSDLEVDWLLNYRGGSFMCKYSPKIQNELVVRGVSYEIIPMLRQTPSSMKLQVLRSIMIL